MAGNYTDVTSDIALATVTDCVDGQSSVAGCSSQTGECVDLDVPQAQTRSAAWHGASTNSSSPGLLTTRP